MKEFTLTSCWRSLKNIGKPSIRKGRTRAIWLIPVSLRSQLSCADGQTFNQLTPRWPYGVSLRPRRPPHAGILR
ncbi:hypothetical protein EVAR_18887_1 [Eumeta japonica]|uniref:Uncharacterized protein n=1 Tax=Eumeta variegata TaxID=151549 RepID=A0A4C1V3D8_EUMVA|nr:hypothetical protein EVAR_18887_1 [Eumeta japonica]